MTEAEWLSCTDPMPMVEFLGDRASKRKCLLFACACERRLWAHPDCERAKVEVTEAFADGQATAADVLAALQDIGIDGVTLESITDCDPVSWAKHESRDSAEFAANVAQQGDEAEHEEDEGAWEAAYAAAKAVQADLARDIFGSPFRAAKLKRSWLAWNDGTIPKLAQAIYDDRAFDGLPMLADALEEAGCTNADILNHCRQPGEHVRGCWLIDLLTGRG
jgi:hypothetical protein